MKEKLQKEFVEKMQECINDGDTESAHANADVLLCELLIKLGYKDLVTEYNKVNKWFA
jgi:hypothetical protein